MMANTSILGQAIGSVMGIGLVLILSAGISGARDPAPRSSPTIPEGTEAIDAAAGRDLALHTITLLNPDAQLRERLTDPGELAGYMTALIDAAGAALAGGPHQNARGLVVAVGIKPGNKVKIWCDAVEGLLPQEELRKLESVLMKVPAIKVKNGPVAFLLSDDAWPHREGSPKLPAAWIEAMAAAKKKSITLPDELFKLIWKK